MIALSLWLCTGHVFCVTIKHNEGCREQLQKNWRMCTISYWTYEKPKCKQSKAFIYNEIMFREKSVDWEPVKAVSQTRVTLKWNVSI